MFADMQDSQNLISSVICWTNYGLGCRMKQLGWLHMGVDRVTCEGGGLNDAISNFLSLT